ncbi:Alpha-amylase [Fibrisoma limi BUZ 3]|uniref:Alpha-amylase n=1 Tax=Fibrisoma limi BUZ 3 TaxID=1185876 RepID=I2GP48_9BACT|nr:alpha-amylase family glycosyl hydrolase [Fibrisoma limi]CCH55676.1 Alpha-amylase [Fibrisoma limi BUZ 3]
MNTPQRLADLDFTSLTNRTFHPSPAAWEDQVLYFLMLDRFSDGQEQSFVDNDGHVVAGGTTPLFQLSDAGNATQTAEQAAQWREAGIRFVGGTLKGLQSKIGYLKRLGITAIWISPIFKQVASQETYHGYGIQNFLDVDPRFGTRDDLRAVVDTAHANGIYVILDIIFNHAGDVFAYATNGQPVFNGTTFPVAGYRDAAGIPSLPFRELDLTLHNSAWPDGAIWPREFQRPDTFTQKGKIQHWDNDPEFLEGDFESLKDIRHGTGSLDTYQPSPTLKAIADVYKYWIAYADLDGFRIDTVKHMELGATRYFSAVIREFAMAIGKENFYLIGEITGGRSRAFTTLELTGLNAALGIDDIPDKLEYLVKGFRNPTEYFDLFRNSELVNKGSHTWFRNRVVTLFDDHDQVRKGNNKARFCADPGAYQQIAAVIALNVLTLGIPCLYYGTEQAFDGAGGNDRYIRESMFGGDFGAFRSANRHFFTESNPAYRVIAQLLALRRQHIALRRGRQYLRPISGNGSQFGLPMMLGGQIRSVVPWSRLFNNEEALCAINTDPQSARTAWVTIDNELHPAGSELTCLFSTDPTQLNTRVTVEARNGKAVKLTVPAGGVVVYK